MEFCHTSDERDRQRVHDEEMARIAERRERNELQLHLLRLLPRSERVQYAQYLWRTQQDGMGGDTTIDWGREIAAATVDARGLAGVWEAEIAPVLGITGGRSWQPNRAQRVR